MTAMVKNLVWQSKWQVIPRKVLEKNNQLLRGNILIITLGPHLPTCIKVNTTIIRGKNLNKVLKEKNKENRIEKLPQLWGKA